MTRRIMTVSVSERTQELMKAHPDTNWSKVFREAVEQRFGNNGGEEPPKWFREWFDWCIKNPEIQTNCK